MNLLERLNYAEMKLDEAMTPAIRVRHVCTGFWGVDVFHTKQEALDELKRRKHEQEKLYP